VARPSLHEILRQMPVLRALPLGALERLASRSRSRAFPQGSRLVEEGRAGDEVFALVRGQVAVRAQLGERDEGAIALRRAGELVGEMALLDDLPRSASLTAEEDVEALCIPRAAFLEAVEGHAPAALELLRVLSRRLREASAAQVDGLRAKAMLLESTNRHLDRENRRLRSEIDERFGFDRFAGSSAAADAVRAAARRAACSDLPVILEGETGTGKEVLARAIHAGSERRRQPFVALNCALFSESLLESQLFGHARGAFTGALAAKPGLVEAAEGGTLFLDELAEMPRPVQAALLRFLELGEFRRLGDIGVRRADVRILAAVQSGPEQEAADGRLRRDLLFRLDVFRIVIPPLRERSEDVPEIAARLSREVAARLGSEPLVLEPDAVAALCAQPFPGNVRELRNEIERLYALHGGGARVTATSLSDRLRGSDPWSARGYGEALRVFKTRLLTETLARASGNRSAAARELGLHPSNLMRMIRELGVDSPPSPRGVARSPRGPRSGAG
jgi:two-component system, NtrC family, response regulator HupR/HoxA